jgi:uncharacterized cupredoxin-like copper-binding protein
MSASAQEQQERVPVWQVLFDDFFLLFLLGVAVPFVFYTVWGLIDIGSIPLAKPVAVVASAPAPTTPADVTVTTTMTEFRYNFSQTSFPVGKVVRFAATNLGKVEHELIIEKVGASNQPLSAGGQTAKITVAPNTMGYLDWTFSEPGEYQISCHIAGHYEAGMVTKVTVTK